MKQDYTYLKKIFKDINPPYAFLFLDELDKNIELVKQRSGTKKIRIATKSLRSLPVLKYLQQQLGTQYCGLMTYHIDEVIWLAQKIPSHFLMGYPQRLSEEQAKKCSDLIQGESRIVHMVDSVEQLNVLNQQALKNQSIFEVCIDLDMSLKLPGLNFGVFRSPLNHISQVKKLYEYIQQCAGIKCVGLMGYEAQIAGVGDNIYKNPLMNFIISVLKKKSVPQIYNLRRQATELAQQYFQLEFINGGGSGSLEITALDPSVTEVTAGSAFYAPALFDSYDKRFYPSAGFAMAVQRKPAKNMITVHGGGYVASGAMDRNKWPVIHAPKAAKLHPNEMTGEVQTPISYFDSDQFNIGDPIFFRHSKAGELLERFQCFHVVKNEVVTEQWNSYRGDGQCFL